MWHGRCKAPEALHLKPLSGYIPLAGPPNNARFLRTEHLAFLHRFGVDDLGGDRSSGRPLCRFGPDRSDANQTRSQAENCGNLGIRQIRKVAYPVAWLKRCSLSSFNVATSVHGVHRAISIIPSVIYFAAYNSIQFIPHAYQIA